jgi:hypothetical protein
MSAVIASTILTILILVAAWFIDQKSLGCQSPVRMIFALITLAIGTWICLTILFACLFQVPGAYGPVQYWVGDMEAHRFISGPRTFALFAILGGQFVAGLSALVTIVSVVSGPRELRVKRMIVPLAGLAIYGLSWWMFIVCSFYPSA